MHIPALRLDAADVAAGCHGANDADNAPADVVRGSFPELCGAQDDEKQVRRLTGLSTPQLVSTVLPNRHDLRSRESEQHLLSTPYKTAYWC